MTFNPNSWPIRLSPSGPFIRDAESGAPLPLGPGSIGIVIRAQGDSGVLGSLASGSPGTIVTGLENVPVSMPQGYLYDVKAIIMCKAPTALPVNAGTFNALIEYSTDGGTTWQAFVPGDSAGPNLYPRCNLPGLTAGQAALVFEEIAIDWRAAARDEITNLRLRVYTALSGAAIECGLCTLRVEQYVSAS